MTEPSTDAGVVAALRVSPGREGAEGVGGLFHSAGFSDLHQDLPRCTLTGTSTGGARALVEFAEVAPGRWRSPGRGTYAGWAWSDDLSLTELDEFVAAAERHLTELGAGVLEVLLPPMAHDPQRYAAAVYVLQSRGWTVDRQDLDSCIVVDGSPLVTRMSRGNAKRSRQGERAGLRAELLPAGDLERVYDTVVANRVARGRSLSMDLAALQALQAACPERILLVGVPVGDVLAAAAVTLRVEPGVRYVYAWGHRPEHARLSPVVLVAEALYAACQRDGIGLLDLGTSTVGAEADPGLLRFKRGLGATESLKTRMSITLQPDAERGTPGPEGARRGT